MATSCEAILPTCKCGFRETCANGEALDVPTRTKKANGFQVIATGNVLLHPVFSIFLVYICIHLHIFAMGFEFLVSQKAQEHLDFLEDCWIQASWEVKSVEVD